MSWANKGPICGSLKKRKNLSSVLAIQNGQFVCTPEYKTVHHRTRIAINCTPSSHFFLFWNSLPVPLFNSGGFFLFFVFFSAMSLCTPPAFSPSGEEVPRRLSTANQHTVSCQKSSCWSYFIWSTNVVGLFALSIYIVQNSFWIIVRQGREEYARDALFL